MFIVITRTGSMFTRALIPRLMISNYWKMLYLDKAQS